MAGVFRRRTAEVEALGAERAALLHEALDAEERERARIGERLHDDALQSLLAARQDVREARARRRCGARVRRRGARRRRARAARDRSRAAPRRARRPRPRARAARRARSRRAAARTSTWRCTSTPAAVGPHDALLYAAARELVGQRREARVGDGVAAARSSARAAGIVLTVADDGVGMTASRPGAALADGHVGLASTRQRVEAAGGTLELRSEPGDGTTIRVTVPVDAPRRADGRVPAAAP